MSIWSFGRVELGLSREEMGQVTRREYVALCRRWKEKETREDRRAALPAWVLANTFRDPKEKPEPYKIEEFMLHYDGGKESATGKRMSPEQMQQTVLRLHAAFGGTRGD
jgi:hypothetical protein